MRCTADSHTLYANAISIACKAQPVAVCFAPPCPSAYLNNFSFGPEYSFNKLLAACMLSCTQAKGNQGIAESERSTALSE